MTCGECSVDLHSTDDSRDVWFTWRFKQKGVKGFGLVLAQKDPEVVEKIAPWSSR